MDKNLDLEYANIDLDRTERTGMQEVIYCAGKTAEQIAGIVGAMVERGLYNILLTRISEEKADFLKKSLDGHEVFYDADGRIGVVDRRLPESPTGNITIVSAGTSDLGVVREAAVTAEVLGNRVHVINDVGVAGIHRLLAREDMIRKARVLIVVAGMEGALASVVGGLVGCPVIAVPTSVGYGASFGGISALLSMLNSCAAGVSVVNIDNGFGAAVSASRINRMETAQD